MATSTRKRQKAVEPIVEIDEGFMRVMARACLAGADQIQEDSITQIKVDWERTTPAAFEESRRAGRDDFGLVGEIHRAAIPEGRWRVYYNRPTATFRLEAIEEPAAAVPVPAPKPASPPTAKAPKPPASRTPAAKAPTVKAPAAKPPATRGTARVAKADPPAVPATKPTRSQTRKAS